jgi:hypothetical protein
MKGLSRGVTLYQTPGHLFYITANQFPMRMVPFPGDVNYPDILFLYGQNNPGNELGITHKNLLTGCGHDSGNGQGKKKGRMKEGRKEGRRIGIIK